MNESPAVRNRDVHDPFGFVLRHVDGTPLFLAPLRGKSSCLTSGPPGAADATSSSRFSRRWQRIIRATRALLFFALNTDDDESLVAPFLAREKWNVPIAFADGLDDLLEVETLPTVLIIDHKGKIVYRVEGFAPDTFSEGIDDGDPVCHDSGENNWRRSRPRYEDGDAGRACCFCADWIAALIVFT